MPPKPKLGQNFLRDTHAIERIVAALGDCSSRTVVEIGPGHGALTRVLATRAAHVLAIELDPELAAHLQSSFPPDRVTVINEDILSFRFTDTASKTGQRLFVVGNLPYYITSPILLKLAANHAVLDRAVLMIQREVADRVAAEPGSRDYGLLSVTTQLYGPIEKLFTLPPSAFSPPPDVHSTVFRWRFAPRVRELGIDETGFLAFLRQAFAQKRKTLFNNLRAAGVSDTTISAAFSAARIDLRARAEELDMTIFAALFRALNAERAAPQNEAAQSTLKSGS